MTLYHQLGDQIIDNENFKLFIDTLQQEPLSSGHILFFCLIEKYFANDHELNWNKDNLHANEAKVLFQIIYQSFLSLLVYRLEVWTNVLAEFSWYH